MAFSLNGSEYAAFSAKGSMGACLRRSYAAGIFERRRERSMEYAACTSGTHAPTTCPFEVADSGQRTAEPPKSRCGQRRPTLSARHKGRAKAANLPRPWATFSAPFA